MQQSALSSRLGYTDGFWIRVPVLLRRGALVSILKSIEVVLFPGMQVRVGFDIDGSGPLYGWEHIENIFSLGPKQTVPFHVVWVDRQSPMEPDNSLLASFFGGKVEVSSHTPERVLQFIDEFKARVTEENISIPVTGPLFGTLAEYRENERAKFDALIATRNTPAREDRWPVHLAGIYGLVAAVLGAAAGAWLTWKLTGH
jgi:hypothetical protein